MSPARQIGRPLALQGGLGAADQPVVVENLEHLDIVDELRDSGAERSRAQPRRRGDDLVDDHADQAQHEIHENEPDRDVDHGVRGHALLPICTMPTRNIGTVAPH